MPVLGLKQVRQCLKERASCWGEEKSTQPDEFAASDACNAVEKKEDVKESPFVEFFNLGSNNEGCWGRNHVVLMQSEDCVGWLPEGGAS